MLARKVGSFVLMPLIIVAVVLAALAYVLGAAFMTVAFTKQQRRDMAVAGAIRTFVKAGEQRRKEYGEEAEEGTEAEQDAATAS